MNTCHILFLVLLVVSILVMQTAQKANPHQPGKFLLLIAAALGAFGSFLSDAHAAKTGSWRLNLNGAWQVAQSGNSEWIAATVPGCIHTDLLAAGKIPDPFYRDNETSVQWVGEANWVYKRLFNISEADLRHDRIFLRCEGIDTLAAVKINGQELGQTDNMFRTYEFDAKPALKTGDNSIEISFASPLPYMKKRNTERTMYEWSGSHEPLGRAWVRKEPCNFGWDWGPVLVTCGIWRNISLEAFDQARLNDVLILQDHSAKDSVKLTVDIAAEMVQPVELKANVTVILKGTKVAASTIAMHNGRGSAEVEIKEPQLWWPVGMGKQPLYDVNLELLDDSGNLIDSTTRRIGLRTIKLLEPDGENSLRFEANGIPFFSKGANWIPADSFANRVTQDKIRRFVADAVAVNMNTLRFWGGGYYEEEALFDACDEMGICVWMDLKFACSAYPAFDDAFMDNVRQEIRDNVRRLRHHPCIAVWCGNNEISLMVKDQWSDKSMGRADYDKLFKDLMGPEVKTLSPQANYVPGSPECGDLHYWEVWHGGKPFEAYRTLAGFISEFGFQSFPEPETVYSYTNEADRASLHTPVMQWHQRSPGGNEKIRNMTGLYFNTPKDFDSALWLSQILQGYGIKMGAEYWRQSMPKSMGCVYWQYNDCWPTASWSSVDYYGRWKALHYMARRFYAPLLVSGLENPAKGTVQIYITSDLLESCRGTLNWVVTDLEGKSLTTGSETMDIGPQKTSTVKLLDLHDIIQAHGKNNILTWLKLIVDGKTVSDNMVFLVPPKELKLADPQLKTTVENAEDGFLVTIKAVKPALWAWLSLDRISATYSDNFVHIAAGTPAQILVHPSKRISTAEFAAALHVHSLIDTYSPSQ
jgi:beta-mannosidase